MSPKVKSVMVIYQKVNVTRRNIFVWKKFHGLKSAQFLGSVNKLFRVTDNDSEKS